MKIIVPILYLVAGLIQAEEAERDPFGPPPEKTAVELVECIRGHKNLRDVPIVYGLIGGQTGSSEIANRARNGDLILGGCIGGSRKNWVVCTTCEMRFDDEYDAWVDSYPRDELAPESEKNPKCSLETIRHVLSKELQHITLELAGAKPSFLSCSCWRDSSGIVGERVLVETALKKTEFLVKFKAWLQYMGAPENMDLDPLNTDYRILGWKSKGKSFSASSNASGKNELFVEIEWHTKKAAEPDGSGQPATRPESKSEGGDKAQPELDDNVGFDSLSPIDSISLGAGLPPRKGEESPPNSASPPDNPSSTQMIPRPGSPGYVRPPNKLPDEAVEALKSGVKFILFSLDPPIKVEAEGGNLKPEESHHGFKILGSTELVNAETKTGAIVSLTDAVRKFGGQGAGCFNPRHSLRVITSKGATYDFVICFECYQIEVYLGEKPLGGVGISGSQKRLDEILTAAKIPLAEPPEA